MRGKAVKLLRKLANSEKNKYKELKQNWRGLSWTKKSNVRKNFEKGVEE